MEKLAAETFIKATGDKEFSIVKKEFKDGTWFVDIASQKWEAHLEISENRKIEYKITLQKDYCLQEANKVLEEKKMPLAIQERSTTWSDGWEFDFLSSFGYFTVRIDSRRKEFVKVRLTPEGIKHFLQLELGGEVMSIKDREEFWDIVVKKKNKKFHVELTKQDMRIQRVRIQKVLGWKEVNIEELREE